MRILFLVTAYPRTSDDVITPWLVELIRRLGERGVEVEVLAPAYRGSGSQRLQGVRVHRFRYAPRRLETLTHDQTTPDRIRERPAYAALVPGYLVAGTRAAARLARTGRFDAVHAFWPLPHGLMGLWAKRATGVPVVCTFFGVELTWMESDLPLLRPLLRRIVRGSDGLTAISHYTAAALRRAVPGAEVTVIPFGAAVDPGPVPPPAMGTPANGFEVLFVGRLVERKGVAVLLDAIARLPDRIRLRVVGDGPLRTELEARAESLRLGGRAVFDGAVSQPVLECRFAQCDALALPAVTDSKGDTEGLGVVLIEAIAHGRPVIASDAGGIPDIVRDGESGLLVPAGDAAALAAAILRLADTPLLRARLVEGGRAHVEREFSWEAIGARLVALYARVAHRPTPHATQ